MSTHGCDPATADFKNKTISDDAPERETIELEGRNYATRAGLARRLGVAPRTLARWDERRIGPPKIKVGKLVLYDMTKLHDWLERHERTPRVGRRSGAGA